LCELPCVDEHVQQRQNQRLEEVAMEQAFEQPTMFSCPACGGEFSTRQQLEFHRNERHPQAEDGTVPELQLQDQQEDEDREVF
jgi:hypothetical protein